MKVIILLGLRVRSGTNFVGTTLKQHPDIQTIPPTSSSGEFNLFREESIKNKVFNSIANRSFGSGVDKKDFPEFMKLYGNLWIKFLTNKFNLDENKTLFLKSPRVKETHLWQLAFPNAKIVLLCRDGRDNVISSIKASNDKRNWHKLSHKFKKRINYYTGRNFINSSKDWAKNAKIYREIVETKSLKKIKYEELNNSYQGVESLLDFYDLNSSKDIVEKCLAAPVVGSSFGVNNHKVKKPNWEPNYDKSKFKFTGKWSRWNKIQKDIFKKIAGKQLVDLGYENDLKW